MKFLGRAFRHKNSGHPSNEYRSSSGHARNVRKKLDALLIASSFGTPYCAVNTSTSCGPNTKYSYFNIYYNISDRGSVLQYTEFFCCAVLVSALYYSRFKDAKIQQQTLLLKMPSNIFRWVPALRAERHPYI